jgi:hypothetical protein
MLVLKEFPILKLGNEILIKLKVRLEYVKFSTILHYIVHLTYFCYIEFGGELSLYMNYFAAEPCWA